MNRYLAIIVSLNIGLGILPKFESMKKTIVLGATTNPERYAYLATMRLAQKGHEVVPVGVKEGDIGGITIQHGMPDVKDVDTVTLYLGAARQKDYYNYILGINPKRIIFNPGTENEELEQLAQEKGIETVEGCTLVMLSVGGY